MNAVFTPRKFNKNLFEAIIQYFRQSRSLKQVELFMEKCCSSSNPPAQDLGYIFFLSSISFSFTIDVM